MFFSANTPITFSKKKDRILFHPGIYLINIRTAIKEIILSKITNDYNYHRIYDKDQGEWYIVENHNFSYFSETQMYEIVQNKKFKNNEMLAEALVSCHCRRTNESNHVTLSGYNYIFWHSRKPIITSSIPINNNQLMYVFRVSKDKTIIIIQINDKIIVGFIHNNIITLPFGVNFICPFVKGQLLRSMKLDYFIVCDVDYKAKKAKLLKVNTGEINNVNFSMKYFPVSSLSKIYQRNIILTDNEDKRVTNIADLSMFIMEE